MVNTKIKKDNGGVNKNVDKNTEKDVEKNINPFDVDNDIITIMMNGAERQVAIRQPNTVDYNIAQKVKSRVFYESLQEGLATVVELEKILKKRGIWGEDKQEEVDKLQKQIAKKEYELAGGNMRLTKGRKLALEIRQLRWAIRELLLERSIYYNNTAEGQADNVHFNCLISRCLVYNDTKEPYFKGLDDYLEKADELVAVWGANRLARILYNIGRETERGFVENEFLLQYRFVNEDLSLVNKNKHLINEDGDLVDEFGNTVDSQGNIVDVAGQSRNVDGKPTVQFKPFIDAGGKAIKIEGSPDKSPTL